MPTDADRYNQITAAARRRSLALTRDTLAFLGQAYGRWFARLDALLQSDSETPYTRARARALRAAVVRSVARFTGTVQTAILQRVQEQARIAAIGHQAATLALSRLRGVRVGVSFAEVPTAALEAMLRRRELAQRYGVANYSDLLALVQKNMKAGAARQVDNLIADGLGQGWSVRRLGREIASVFDPAASPALLSHAEMVAVSELRGAYDEADKQAAAQNTMIAAVRWMLSGNHQKPDACDLAATADLYGLGAGLYPPEHTPSLLHPRCTCTTQQVLRPISEWNTPRPAPGEPRRVTSTAALGSLSDKAQARQVAVLQSKLDAAIEASTPRNRAA